jgi:opacity protein-like surface antigen
MKSTTHLANYIGIALFLGCASSQAADWSDNLYLHTDIGSASLANGSTTTRGFSLSGPFQSRGSFRADTGIRGDLALGYNLTKSLALEVDSGAIWNQGPNPQDDFYQIPVMLNVVYQIRLSDSWKAYLGAGAGGVVSITHSQFRDPAFHTPIVLEDSAASFGYQAEAGINYALSHHLEIGLKYKFLGVDEYDYHLGPPGVFVEDVKVHDLFTHSAQVSLTWKF